MSNDIAASTVDHHVKVVKISDTYFLFTATYSNGVEIRAKFGKTASGKDDSTYISYSDTTKKVDSSFLVKDVIAVQGGKKVEEIFKEDKAEIGKLKEKYNLSDADLETPKMSMEYRLKLEPRLVARYKGKEVDKLMNALINDESPVTENEQGNPKPSDTPTASAPQKPADIPAKTPTSLPEYETFRKALYKAEIISNRDGEGYKPLKAGAESTIWKYSYIDKYILPKIGLGAYVGLLAPKDAKADDGVAIGNLVPTLAKLVLPDVKKAGKYREDMNDFEILKAAGMTLDIATADTDGRTSDAPETTSPASSLNRAGTARASKGQSAEQLRKAAFEDPALAGLPDYLKIALAKFATTGSRKHALSSAVIKQWKKEIDQANPKLLAGLDYNNGGWCDIFIYKVFLDAFKATGNPDYDPKNLPAGNHWENYGSDAKKLNTLKVGDLIATANHLGFITRINGKNADVFSGDIYNGSSDAGFVSTASIPLSEIEYARHVPGTEIKADQVTADTQRALAAYVV
jgi:hypothetical protein